MSDDGTVTLAYPGRSGQFQVRGRQIALQAADYPWIDDVVAFDAEAHQSFSGFPLIAVAVTGMRGDGVDVARSIGGDAFEVVELPEIAVTPRPERSAQGRVTDVAASDTKETQRMLLFVLDNEKAAVGELLDAGRLVDPGQGLKDRDVIWRHFGGLPLRLPAPPARRNAPSGAPLRLRRKGKACQTMRLISMSCGPN